MPALYNNQVFPGGHKKTLEIGATAGNVITNFVPGVGLRWVILRFRFILICDANLGNRIVNPQITNGTILTGDIIAGAITAPSATSTNGWGETQYINGGSLLQNCTNGIMPIIINGVDELRISIAGGVVGDSYSGTVDVLEMAVE